MRLRLDVFKDAGLPVINLASTDHGGFTIACTQRLHAQMESHKRGTARSVHRNRWPQQVQVVGHPIADCCCTSSKSIPNIELILKGFSTIQMKLRERDLTASAALKRSNAMPDVYAPTFWEREW